MSCDHLEWRTRTYTIVDWEEGEKTITERDQYSSTVDVDVHRYRCTRCGEIGYYSGAARQHYEKGTSFPGINGLE